MNLPNGTQLQGGKYRIEGMLGQGGFGITYRAEQVMLGRTVAIKEFFIREYCERSGDTGYVTIGTQSNRDMVELYRKKFLNEARLISNLHHPGIVQIHDIFEENGTAYYVMEYLAGESLADMVKRRGPLPEDEAEMYMFAVGKALEYIHGKHINHLDVKPSNIIVCDNKKVVLIDFGVSKQYDAVTDKGTSTTPVGISHGYSPAEQYLQGGVQHFSPSSDVYSLAATLYYLLTGVRPPEAPIVQDTGLPLHLLERQGVSQMVRVILSTAMTSRSRRTQTINAFLTALMSARALAPRRETSSDVTIIKMPEPEPNPVSEPEPKPKPEPSPEPKSESKSESKPESEPQPMQALKAESTPAPQSDPMPEPTTEPKPELKSESEPKQGQTPASEPYPMLEPQPDPKKRSKWWAVVITAVVSFCVVFALFYLGKKDVSSENSEESAIVEAVQGTEEAAIMTYAPDNSVYLYTGPVDENGLPHGEGEAKWQNDNRTYKGAFNHGKMEGQGVFVDNAGNRFEGQMKNDTYYDGKMYMKDGDWFEGTIKDDAPLDGVWHMKNGTTQKVKNGNAVTSKVESPKKKKENPERNKLASTPKQQPKQQQQKQQPQPKPKETIGGPEEKRSLGID